MLAPAPASERPLANPTILPSGVSAGRFGKAMRVLLADPGVDAVIAYYVDAFAGEPDAVISAIARAAADMAKPVAASVLTAEGQLPAWSTRSVPNFLFLEACAAVISRAAERRERLSRPIGLRPEFRDLRPGAAHAVIAARTPDGSESSAWLTAGDASNS